jgi:hypothetical protein
MSCDLGCLVNARRSLYQSKPSIEAWEATTLGGGRKHLGTSLWTNRMQWAGHVRRVGHRLASAPASTYLSHRANSPPTPRLDARKRRSHCDFRPLGLLGLGRLTAELAPSAQTPRQVGRPPANTHLLGQQVPGVSAEYDRPSADFWRPIAVVPVSRSRALVAIRTRCRGLGQDWLDSRQRPSDRGRERFVAAGSETTSPSN